MAKSTGAQEIDIQQAFRKRCYYGAPRVQIVAIPNAARRTQWEVMRAKKEGLRTGFPDVMCLWPGGGVCFLEFKAAKGRLTDNQAEWQARLADMGFVVGIVRSADEAMNALREAGAPVMERAA
jgi:hypothetical protein